MKKRVKPFEYSIELTVIEAMQSNGHGLFHFVESILSEMGIDNSCEVEVRNGGNRKGREIVYTLPHGEVHYKRERKDVDTEDIIAYKDCVTITPYSSDKKFVRNLRRRLNEMKEWYESRHEQSWLSR